MKNFSELLKSKKQTKMDPTEKSAKMGVLGDLKKMASGMMGDDVKGLKSGVKQVTVAAPDKEGLETGLDKAKTLLGDDHGEAGAQSVMDDMHDKAGTEDEESPSEEASETPDEEHGEDQVSSLMSAVQNDPSLENITNLMNALYQKKQKMADGQDSEAHDSMA